MVAMTITLRLTDEELAALRSQAEAAGISVEEVVRIAIRDHVGRAERRDRVRAAAEVVEQHHADALRRLS